MKYRVIDTTGHRFPLHTIVNSSKFANNKALGYYSNKDGLIQILDSYQLSKCIELNTNIKVL